jgi:class 3 adenylate cyclase/tetratricopeptide (TPR) repeat protein
MTLAGTPCPSCGCDNRERARFCDECGAPLEGSEELRYGTILFCDLVDSTGLTKRLDFEDQRIVYRTFREVVGRIAADHGGSRHEMQGDGAFVSFGILTAREDAEESALRAGLALVAALRSSKPRPGVDLDLRVGIASGTVVVERGSVTGIVKNTARRLLEHASPGGVVIADTTRRLAGRFFEYRDLGRLSSKGFENDGIQAWLVGGETSIASRFEAQHLSESPAQLLGRGDVAERLAEAWERACRGSGQVIVLAGEAGIGKSRLARTVSEHARSAGKRTLVFDCTERASDTPLFPVSVLLRRSIERRSRRQAHTKTAERRLGVLLRRLLGADRAAVAARYLGPLVGIESAEGPTDESAERIRDRVIDQLIKLLGAVSDRGPTMLLFEDMHWADPTTKFLVQKMCEEVASRAVLVVATTRSAGELELPGALTISVEPLDGVAAEGIVRHTPGGELLPAQVVAGILDRAEGNPFFIEELTRAVVEQPLVVGAGQHSGTEVAADVPVKVGVVIAARLDRRPQLKPVVQAASVLGREFPMPLLTALLSDRGGELPEAIAWLVDLELLTTDGRGKVRFKHALIHDSVYQTILPSEKQHLHSRAAEVLVRHFDGMPESAPDLLSHHLAAAGRFEEAARSLIVAAGSTRDRAAYLESVRHCRKGLALVDKVNDSTVRRELKLELLKQLGVALAATSGYATKEVEEVYRQAHALCDEGAASTVLFPIVRGLGTFYFVRCDLENAANMSASCIRLAQESRRPDFLIEALSFRGYTCVYCGQLAEGRNALEECIKLYQAHGGQDLRYPSPQDAGTAAWSLLGIAAWLMGDAAGAESAVAGAIQHSKQLGRAFDTAYVHVWIAMLRNMQRRFDEAKEHAAECIEICQKHGFETWFAAATMHDCIATAARLATPQSIAELRQWLDRFIRSGAEANASFFLWGMALGLRLTGEISRARETVTEALRRADATGEFYFKSELLVLAAELESDEEIAHNHLRQAFEVAEQQGAITLSLRAALEILRRQGRSSGDPERDRQARLALEGVTPYPETHDWARVALGAARIVLGSSGAPGIL